MKKTPQTKKKAPKTTKPEAPHWLKFQEILKNLPGQKGALDYPHPQLHHQVPGDL